MTQRLRCIYPPAHFCIHLYLPFSPLIFPFLSTPAVHVMRCGDLLASLAVHISPSWLLLSPCCLLFFSIFPYSFFLSFFSLFSRVKARLPPSYSLCCCLLCHLHFPLQSRDSKTGSVWHKVHKLSLL